MASPAVGLERRNSNEDMVLAKKENLKRSNGVTIASGHTLVGKELEDFCSQRGLCPLCARTKTQRKIFKLFQRSKWERLTLKDKNGKYTVYKGFCVKPDCFSLEQAKRMAGDGLKKSFSRPRYPKRWSSVDDNNPLGDDDTVESSTSAPETPAFPSPELKDQMKENSTKSDLPLSIVRHVVETMRPSITILDLSKIQMRTTDVTALCSSLLSNTTLSSLIMDNCNMDEEQAIILGKTLSQAHDIPLCKLYLHANKIGDDGVDSICPFLQSSSTLE
eukprot:scaffold26597_cov127-Cylindrotheca_fusiformis.AAC.2